MYSSPIPVGAQSQWRADCSMAEFRYAVQSLSELVDGVASSSEHMVTSNEELFSRAAHGAPLPGASPSKSVASTPPTGRLGEHGES
ncbi:hypothetical protein P3T76_012699 [Phytophthora citrophthora]|uniref:Uncharacterized protein n=1 Tax=Phytophthora citrophthora TaxID=4793 RepID=A0AAD9G567_9STRA|nr:hypothetical protein P3T76_012699 [Phytophthora citrophthora]